MKLHSGRKKEKQMPFKPIAEPEDYPERLKPRDRDMGSLQAQQDDRLKMLIGDDLWDFLEREENHGAGS